MGMVGYFPHCAQLFLWGEHCSCLTALEKLVVVPEKFLLYIAKQHGVSDTELEVLSAALQGEAMSAIANRLGIRPEAARKRLGEVYKKFSIPGAGPGKLAKLQQILVNQHTLYQKGGDALGSLNEAIEEEEIPDSTEDWGEAPDTSNFFGRTEVLKSLQDWVLSEDCRLIALLGIGGIGKTTLAVKLARDLAETGEFEFVVWRSLRRAASPRETIHRLIRFIAREKRVAIPDRPDDRISMLLDGLRQHRCLIVLDNWESALQPGEMTGHYREGMDEYRDLLRRLGEETHKSCVIVTSAEKPKEIAILDGQSMPVRVLEVPALNAEEGAEIFRAKQLDEEQLWPELIDLYRGNPLTLKIVSNTILELFSGKVSEFLKESTLVFGDIKELLRQQFDRLSDLEKSILYWLSIEHEPISLGQLRDDLVLPSTHSELLEALESLGRRSLIERAPGEGSALFTLQPVVLEYVALDLAERATGELQDLIKTQRVERLEVFRNHALLVGEDESEEDADGIPRPLKEVLNRLRRSIRNDRQMVEFLEISLEVLKDRFPLEVGYAANNVEHLLGTLRDEMNGYAA